MDNNQNDQLINWLIKIINFIKKNKNNKHIINKQNNKKNNKKKIKKMKTN